jgi:beta-phosphoglucomutase
MTPYEAILFDFDGVLIDSEPVHFGCWADVLQPLGIQFDWDLYQKHCIGLDDRKLLNFLCHLKNPPLSLDHIWVTQYPSKQQMFVKKMTSSPPFPATVVELLKSLSDYKLSVVTSSGRSEVEPVLEAGGIRPLFQAVVCAEDVTRHKPAPDPYLLAAKLLDIKSAVVVEDSDAGLQSARAAGFDVIQVRSPEETAQAVLSRL